MKSTGNPGRFVGLLYVSVSFLGLFALIYVPNKVMVHGDAAATAGNLAAHETLFRMGIAAELASQILFLWVALALYDLLKGVGQRPAMLMFGLFAVSVPIALANELNAMAALVLMRGENFLSVMEKPQRDALAMLFLNLHGRGFGICEIFWGLWLFPLGLLVYRSGFIPRILGVLLMVSCFAFVAESGTALVLPEYGAMVSRWTGVLRSGELVLMFWLLIVGAKPKAVVAAPAVG
jgi:hypothetical protein